MHLVLPIPGPAETNDTELPWAPTLGRSTQHRSRFFATLDESEMTDHEGAARRRWAQPIRAPLAFASLRGWVLLPGQGAAWGDVGHHIIALVAEQYLEPATGAEVGAMLGADRDSLSAHDIASEATWADWYRDSDREGSRERYRHTRHCRAHRFDSGRLRQQRRGSSGPCLLDPLLPASQRNGGLSQRRTP